MDFLTALRQVLEDPSALAIKNPGTVHKLVVDRQAEDIHIVYLEDGQMFAMSAEMYLSDSWEVVSQ